ncbi:MAG TPA: DUF4397 domain-containing protein [Gemmatimonadales bacterium]|nr:DUF4397 domain-containing protein [Gemmatimonadales bacterium]
MLLAVGCKKDATFTEPLPDYAHITWLNAVQDTMQLDMRVIDIPTNASFMDADFRSAQFFPLNIEPGARHIKVFLSSGVDTIAKKFLLDTTYTFADGGTYSFYLTGQARSGRPIPVHAMITNLNAVNPGAGKFAIRVVSLAPTLGGALAGTLPDTTAAPDVHILAANGVPGTPAAGSFGYGSATQYVVLDTGAYYIALTAPGAVTPKAVIGTVPPGIVGSPGTPPVAGSRISGSVFTAVIVPHSDTLSPAPKSRAGRGAPLATDTSVSEAARRLTLSGDTVTVQLGSIRQLVNRRASGGAVLADTTLSRTGTGSATTATVGQSILVENAGQPEYNGWQNVMAIADTLICSPSNPNDVTYGSSRHCAGPAVGDTAASQDTAVTRFRFQYRIVGAPLSPGTGGVTYRLYGSTNTATDFVIPQFLFIVDKRP